MMGHRTPKVHAVIIDFSQWSIMSCHKLTFHQLTYIHDFYTIVHNGKNKLCDECGECKLQTHHHHCRFDEPGCARARATGATLWVFVSVKLNTNTLTLLPETARQLHPFFAPLYTHFMWGDYIYSERLQRKQIFIKKSRSTGITHKPQQRMCECIVMYLLKGFHSFVEAVRARIQTYVRYSYCWSPPHNACSLREWWSSALLASTVSITHVVMNNTTVSAQISVPIVCLLHGLPKRIFPNCDGYIFCDKTFSAAQSYPTGNYTYFGLHVIHIP